VRQSEGRVVRGKIHRLVGVNDFGCGQGYVRVGSALARVRKATLGTYT
jgi:hypothetical protein